MAARVSILHGSPGGSLGGAASTAARVGRFHSSPDGGFRGSPGGQLARRPVWAAYVAAQVDDTSVAVRVGDLHGRLCRDLRGRPGGRLRGSSGGRPPWQLRWVTPEAAREGNASPWQLR